MKIRLLFTTLLLTLLSIGVYAQNEKEAYVVIDKDGTATFYYNDSKPEGALPIQSSANDANWTKNVRNSVKRVVFDASFKEYEPTRCSYWFYRLKKLSEISGMKENLNTANVTDMYCLFDGCSNLSTINLSNFNTAIVTNMSYMFSECRGLSTLDLSNFNTANVTNMSYMFSGCSGLTSLDLSNFNTANVTDMNYMFYSCSGLFTIDISSFNTTKVADLRNLFVCCNNLAHIYIH